MAAAGPVVAGVVGVRRFFDGVWDTVKLAVRMESTGSEGPVQVSQDVCERLENDFLFEERGDVESTERATYIPVFTTRRG